jgi:hypothetical protein
MVATRAFRGGLTSTFITGATAPANPPEATNMDDSKSVSDATVFESPLRPACARLLRTGVERTPVHVDRLLGLYMRTFWSATI